MADASVASLAAAIGNARRVEYPRARRLAILRRMLPATASELREAYPDAWPSGYYPHARGAAMESRKLFRDLHELGAVSRDGLWRLPEPA